MDGLCLKPGFPGVAPAISVGGTGAASLEVRANVSQVSATPPQRAGSRFPFRFGYPLRSFWLGGGGKSNDSSNRYNGIAVDDADAVFVENRETAETRAMGLSSRPLSEGKEGNSWVFKILHLRSIWKEGKKSSSGGDGMDYKDDAAEMSSGVNNNDGENEELEECDACRVDDDDEDDEKGTEFDKNSFSRLLRKVSLAEAKLYAQMSYLGNVAYSIPKIKAGNLLKYSGLQYVTSSIEKRESSVETQKIQVSAEDQEVETKKRDPETESKVERGKHNGYHMNAATAYQIAASAASYLHSHAKSVLPLKSSKSEAGKVSSESGNGSNIDVNVMYSDVASLMATTDSVTAVVSAKEEVKQAVADDLSSTRSSPCEWFICDDDQDTRYFVIQGSESLASWQANLLFEPVQFEEMDVLVHRGIYEAAKGMYEQMLPEVHSHLKNHGRHATFRFTGHSLGGSLSLLINLMLIIRKEVPASALLPVITFGAPSIMCGGDYLLRKLGLSRSHVQAITMHRDIVPRVFSCNYPKHVAKLLKAVNRNFRNHPCLNNQKLLYAPIGELLILQPDEKFSPHHHLLPSGSGLYFLSCPLSDTNDAEKLLQSAQNVFLNSPHPLEILSDRSAYGAKGTIRRYHLMSSYLKSVRAVVRQELNRIRKSRREHRRKFWWSLVAPGAAISSGVLMERPQVSINKGQNQFSFSGVLHTGRESFKRFNRLIASQHMHLLVVILFPAKLLLLGAYSLINIR